VQDTNAYTIQEPKGLGAMAASLFKRASESKKWSVAAAGFVGSSRRRRAAPAMRQPIS
jgi:hypothetical protein